MNQNVINGRLPGLDTLRALAVLVVVLYHLTIFGELPERLLPVSYFGWMGVDLFFVLSGYLIGLQVLRPYARGRRPSLRDFWLRRAFRILPAYLVVLALYFAVPAWRESPHLPAVGKLLTFTMNFGFTFARRGFSHAWSLCVEEHFYLALPLLIAALMRKPRTSRAIVLVACVVMFGIALRAWLVARYPDAVWQKIYYPTYTRLDGLVAGVSLAAVRVFRPGWWARLEHRGHALLFAGVECVAAEVWMLRRYDLGNSEGSAKWAVIVGFPLLAWGLGMIVASALSRNGLLARWRVPGAQTLATLAFSLYLTHKEIAHLVRTVFPHITDAKGWQSWMLYTVFCLAAAALLYLLVERPALRLRDRILKHTPPPRLDPAL